MKRVYDTSEKTMKKTLTQVKFEGTLAGTNVGKKTKVLMLITQLFSTDPFSTPLQRLPFQKNEVKQTVYFH